LLSGLAYATGVVRSVAGLESVWWHIAIALAVIPLVLWHVLARPARPRRTDLSRRNVLRAGSLAGLGIAAYATIAATVQLARLPGARRRFTGSYEVGSFAPDLMPDTIWLNDTEPRVDPDAWRLTVGDRVFGLTELQRYTHTIRATLDCTSGWYAEQDWTGVRLADLVRPEHSHRSIAVHSATGYWVRFPLGDLDSLLLATRAGDRPLSIGHGFPLRLVAPGRRGYWWVKWVDRVELRSTPWWWQPPFPIT
jgi:DMSO/TMAO reductase YedYZ molybdopterin-dependent catalytic subunit